MSDTYIYLITRMLHLLKSIPKDFFVMKKLLILLLTLADSIIILKFCFIYEMKISIEDDILELRRY